MGANAMRMRAIRRLLWLPMLALGLAGGTAAGPAVAQSIVSTGESFADIRLVAGRAEPGGARMAGLVVDVAPGWKTYWRSPGEAGVPPVFDWSRSTNLASAELLWPRPERFESFGLATLGYGGQVVFPVRLEPRDPARPIEARLDLSLGVCRDLCVMEDTTVTAHIAPDAPGEGAALVAAGEAAVPRPGAEVGLSAAHCRITGSGRDRVFEATLDFDRPVEAPVVAVEGPELAWFNDIETATGSGGRRLRVAAGVSLADDQVWIGRSDIRMTVLARDFAADIKGCTAPAG